MRAPSVPQPSPLSLQAETCGGQLTLDLYKLVSAEEPDHEEYVGCWSDTDESRVMQDMLVDNDMTTDMCRDHCEGSDAVYYATQYGSECFCGYSSDPEDYEAHGPGTCHMHCAGDSESACGELLTRTGQGCVGDGAGLAHPKCRFFCVCPKTRL